MNAPETIFALALASNLQPKQHLMQAIQQLSALGQVQLSRVYQIPCRDGVGADYLNAACLLHSLASMAEIQQRLEQLEQLAGRIRPSHHISLDVDLIAWGQSLNNMQFNPKKCPLALDVKIPLAELWSHPDLQTVVHKFPVLLLNNDANGD